MSRSTGWSAFVINTHRFRDVKFVKNWKADRVVILAAQSPSTPACKVARGNSTILRTVCQMRTAPNA
ncbi:hypothetical protein MFIFM68171_00128 [Madurella fahalii]|uniref:Uncharacterized protein n=1 Tax=Madurella fahalii TaxID=1157608 RepID=A0ABQ0FWN9_9PEZI